MAFSADSIKTTDSLKFCSNCRQIRFAFQIRSLRPTVHTLICSDQICVFRPSPASLHAVTIPCAGDAVGSYLAKP